MGLFDKNFTPQPAAPRVVPPPDPALLARLEKVRRPCWVPQTEPGDGPIQGSKFSGLPALAAGERWPPCPCCRQPMQLFLQLNANELPPEMGRPFGEGLLQLFYCISSDPACETERSGWEPFSPCSLLRVVGFGGVKPARNPVRGPLGASRIVGWTFKDDYPNGEERAALDAVLLNAEGETDEAAEAAVEKVYPLVGPKLGGWPHWVQSVEYPACPKCGATMRHLFQIDSDDPLEYMFGDAGCGHITQCPEHPEVLAFGWACF